MKKSIAPAPFVAAMPVVLVAVKDGDKINFATHGMYGQLSNDPPLIYVSVMKNHLTAQLIKNARNFSINIPSSNLLEKIKYSGKVSGIEQDKSKLYDVFYSKNDVPLISDCPININCELFDIIDTKEMYVFIGKVIELFAEEKCIVDNELIATKVAPIICTIQQKYFELGKEL